VFVVEQVVAFLDINRITMGSHRTAPDDIRFTVDDEVLLNLRLLGYSRAVESIDRLEAIQGGGRTGASSRPGWRWTILAGLTGSHRFSTVTPNNGGNGPRRGVMSGYWCPADRHQPVS
jgi:hypothetical protein